MQPHTSLQVKQHILLKLFKQTLILLLIAVQYLYILAWTQGNNVDFVLHHQRHPVAVRKSRHLVGLTPEYLPLDVLQAQINGRRPAKGHTRTCWRGYISSGGLPGETWKELAVSKEG